MGATMDLTGLRVGRLAVVSQALDKKYPRPHWRCACDCGREKVVCGGNLKGLDATRSCGCLVVDTNGPRFRTHGKSRTPTYVSWLAMRERCFSPKHHAYARYGGRGITVCEKWVLSFEAFYRDMGERPPEQSLDRINNDLGYFKENCRWATRSEQNKNRRPRAKRSAHE